MGKSRGPRTGEVVEYNEGNKQTSVMPKENNGPGPINEHESNGQWSEVTQWQIEPSEQGKCSEHLTGLEICAMKRMGGKLDEPMMGQSVELVESRKGQRG